MERTEDIHITLYPEQINNVKLYAKYHNIRSISQAYQQIIDDFFNHDDKSLRNDFILYLLTPLIFCILTTIVNISTFRVYTALLKQGLFYDELFMLSQAFMVISFLSIGVLIACVYLFRKKYIEHKKIVEVLDGNTNQ